MSMTPRERVLTAFRRGVPDRVPKAIGFTPGALRKFQEGTGGANPADYFDIETRGVGLAPTRLETDFTACHQPLPEGTKIDEWGVARVPGSKHHFVRLEFPLASATSIEEVEAYPFPDLTADYRYEEMATRVDEIRESGYASIATVSSHNYVAAWQLRGLKAFLSDMVANPKLAEAIIDRTTEMSVGMVERFAKAGVDIIMYGEDIASQQSLVMSPGMWREWLFPRLKRVIDAAHAARPDVIFVYHSDGNVTDAVPGLVEAGIDVLNPLQPECMNVARIKEEYGTTIALWGGLSVQQTMPWGTPADVRNEVRERMTTLGKNGGYLIAPSHTIEPEVPFENVEAFKEAVEEFGDYA